MAQAPVLPGMAGYGRLVTTTIIRIIMSSSIMVRSKAPIKHIVQSGVVGNWAGVGAGGGGGVGGVGAGAGAGGIITIGV